jgi:hypothetical protein
MSVQVVVVERVRGARALRRSWEVTRGSGWKILGNMLVVSLLAGVLTSLLTFVPQVMWFLAGEGWWWVMVATTAIAGAISAAIITTAQTLLYLHCRATREALTLDTLVREVTPSS